MSKWILPPEGADQTTPVTKQPLVVRVRGVKGPEQARLVAAQYQSQIDHFLTGQITKRALSGLPIYKAHTEGPGIRLIYSYQHGMEYLDIQVSAGVSKRSEERNKRYRDLVLITLEYDDMWGITATHSAYLITPTLQQLPVVDGPVRGVAHEDNVTYADDGTVQPIVQFPPLDGHARFAAPFVENTAKGRQRSTVLLDTRPITGLPTYTIDIYGALVANTDRDSTCRQTGWFFDHQETNPTETALLHEFQYSFGTASPDTIPAGHEEFAADDWWTLPSPSSTFTFTPFEPLETIYGLDEVPPHWDGIIHYIQVGTAYHVLSDGLTIDGTSHYTGETASTFYQWIVTYTFTNSGIYIYNPLTTRDPGPRVFRRPQVFATLLDSDDILGTVHTSGDETVDDGTLCGPYALGQNFNSWEFRQFYPTHLNDFAFGPAPSEISSPWTSSTVAQHLGKQPICRITFDRERTTVFIGLVT